MPRSRWTGLVLGAAVVLAGAAPCTAQPGDARPRSTHPASPTGYTRYAPGRWGAVATAVANPGDEPADVLASVYFEGDPGRQFARQLWVPPHARRTSWLPVLPPASMPLNRSAATVKSLLIDRSRGREVVLQNPDGRVAYEGLLAVRQEAQGTAILGGDEDAIRALVVARQARRLSVQVVRLTDDTFPPAAEAFEAMDHLLVCDSRPLTDGAGLTALRRWLYGGGHLWVALDRVDLDTVATLLGDAPALHVVDRVALADWDIVGSAPGTSRTRNAQRVGDFDRPAELIRVEAPGLRVSHTVNGWPAALWLPAGNGTVLFTTLAGRGWVRPRGKQDGRAPEPHHASAAWAPTDALGQLAFEFFRPSEPPTLDPRVWEAFASEQVGYRIVGRGTVAAVLGTFCAGLLAAGLWLARTQRLAALGWAGPAGALAAALVLVVLGQASRNAVPPTVAAAQFVEADPGSAGLRVTGTLAVYNPQEAAEPIGADDGGLFIPDRAAPEAGTTRRLVWTDLGRWHWENLPLPAGLHLMPFEYVKPTATPVAARLTFGPGGAVGSRDPGPLRDAADALVALPGGRRLAVRLAEDGSFAAGPDSLLPPGQFLAADVLSDEQRRRAVIYRHLLADPKRTDYPSRPLLLTWAAPLDTRFRFPAEARRTGSALVAVPLEFRRPAPGTRVLIPEPFLLARTAVRPGAMASWYKPELGSWLGPMQQGGHTMLRFQLPPETYPLRLERVRLTLDMSSPGREVTVTTVAGDAIAPVTTLRAPEGAVRVQLPADALRLDERGGLLLGLRVGETTPERDWKIHDVRLEIEGQALEP